jgi:hypothetical protein
MRAATHGVTGVDEWGVCVLWCGRGVWAQNACAALTNGWQQRQMHVHV